MNLQETTLNIHTCCKIHKQIKTGRVLSPSGFYYIQLWLKSSFFLSLSSLKIQPV